MESFLSTVFPCCFPRARHSTSTHDERTPLLTSSNNPPSSSSRNSIADNANGGTATTLGGSGGLEAKKLKRKQNSILPTPAYDANVLKGIVDEFLGKVVAVDSSASTGGGEKGGASSSSSFLGMLLSSSSSSSSSSNDEEVTKGQTAEQGQGSAENKVETKADIPFPTTTSSKPLTPIHSLRINLSSTPSSSHDSSSLHNTRPTKLVDIWTDQPPLAPPSSTPPPASTTLLSYSAAVKRGAKKSNKKSSSNKPKPTQNVEQTFYENLAQFVTQNPLVHTWQLDDDPSILSNLVGRRQHEQR
ncbi:uncharacterized protein UTRI_03770 [Ustilago trichophora]|uniref:Uncharacterized protein n=1 Tax=Ustilago trichophora TaxID=86804 RepID=A0A5C3E4Z4_9BASI|nr:uncharacterized protein UTRI_03770 [Ustilago trichophora]